MISYMAIATVAIGLLAASPQPHAWEVSYGKALEASARTRVRCWWCSITPTAKKHGLSHHYLAMAIRTRCVPIDCVMSMLRRNMARKWPRRLTPKAFRTWPLSIRRGPQ